MVHPLKPDGRIDYSKVVRCQCHAHFGNEMITSASGQYPQSTDAEIDNFVPMPDTRGTATDWYGAAGIISALLASDNKPIEIKGTVTLPISVIDDYRAEIFRLKTILNKRETRVGVNAYAF